MTEFTADEIIVGYWNIKGLASALRMSCHFAGVPYKVHSYALDETFNRDEWLTQAKLELKEKNAYINLPYVIDGDIVITQSNACMSYLGRKLNQWGNDEISIIKCEQLLCELMDLRNSVVRFSYPATSDTVNDFLNGCKDGKLYEYRLQHLS